MYRVLSLVVLFAVVVLTSACERLKYELGGPVRSKSITMYEEPRVTYTYEIDPNVPVTSHLQGKAATPGF